jgi:hypothetical protein
MTTIGFPADDEVLSATAAVFYVDGFTTPVPEFSIPLKYMPKVLSAFRPPQPHSYPASWDEEKMGCVTIRTKAGRTIPIMFPYSGKGPLCFTLDGVRCVRGGVRQPLYVGKYESQNTWVSECALLASILKEIHHEQTTGEQSARLVEKLEALERSAGLRPPERASR